MLSATRLGFSNTAAFYAPDAQQDLHFLADFVGTGRATIVQGARDFQQMPPREMGGWDQSDAHDATRVEPVFLGSGDLLDVRAIPTCGYTVADRMTVAPAGITGETMAGSLARAESFHSGWAALAQPIADHYVDAWAGGRGSAVAPLYAPGAVLRDSLRGIRATGRHAIAALAGSGAAGGGLLLARLATEGPAVFLTGGFAAAGPGASWLGGLTLLLDVGTASCGDVVAVDLTLDAGGRITGEERFHRIDRLGGCGAPAVPTAGWWATARIPERPVVRRSVDLPWTGGGVHPIAVWNGGPRIDPIVTWARERFAAAGLAPPEPASVTFLPAVPGDRWATYGFATGTHAIDLGLPFTADEACLDAACTAWRASAKAAALHELAHLWTVTGSRRLGPPGVSPWGRAGSERAAETIAWGLMDEPYAVDGRMGDAGCARLAADFEVLTGSTPDPRACGTPTTAR